MRGKTTGGSPVPRILTGITVPDWSGSALDNFSANQTDFVIHLTETWCLLFSTKEAKQVGHASAQARRCCYLVCHRVLSYARWAMHTRTIRMEQERRRYRLHEQHGHAQQWQTLYLR